MAKIGEVLIREGHLTPEGLEEALDWQVLYGGRLGTNLLELRLVGEEQLARALGKQLGAEVAWGELQVDPSLVSSIPKHVADRHEIVPWKVEKRRLKLLCCEIKVSELDQLSYKTGRTCVPVIAPEFRVFQLLRMHYQAIRQMRALDFGVVPEEGRRRKRKAKEVEKLADTTPELIDEGAFNEIYNRMVQPAGTPPQPAPPITAPAAREPAASWYSHRGQSSRAPVLPHIQPPEPQPEEEKLESLAQRAQELTRKQETLNKEHESESAKTDPQSSPEASKPTDGEPPKGSEQQKNSERNNADRERERAEEPLHIVR